jgi:hypothetical protein
MKRKTYLLITMVIAMLLSYSVKAQVFQCNPTICYTWTVVNNTDTELALDTDYFWGPDCPSLHGGIWHTVKIPAWSQGQYSPRKKKVGCDPAVSYCTDANPCVECRCGTHMRVQDCSGLGYFPWAFANPSYSGPPYPVPATPGTTPAFMDCTTGQGVFATFDVTTNTMTFAY